MTSTSETDELPSNDELLLELQAAVQDVFTTMVVCNFEKLPHQTVSNDAPEAEPEPEPQPAEGESKSFAMEASVDFSGPVAGKVILRCTSDGGVDIARGLLMLDESEALEVEDVADALGDAERDDAGSFGKRRLSSFLPPMGASRLDRRPQGGQ